MLIKVAKTNIVRPENILPVEVMQGMDSSGSRYVAEELLKLETTVYRHITGAISFNEMFNVTSGGPGLESVGYTQQTATGKSQWGSRGQTSAEKGQITRRRHTRPVLPILTSYAFDWKDEEIAGSNMVMNFNLEADEALAAKDRNFALLDEASIMGGVNDELQEIKGILHFCNGGSAANNSIPKSSITGAWSGATGKEIYQDVSRGIESVYTNSKKNGTCNTVAMGLTAKSHLTENYVETTAGAGVKTVWEALQTTYGDRVRFVFNPLLDGVTFDGVDNETFSNDGVMLFYDNNPLYHNFEVPQLFRILRPYKYNGGLSVEVNCLSECAGLAIKYLPMFSYAVGHT